VQLPGGGTQNLPKEQTSAITNLDLLLMFDTTGSMYSYLEDVRSSLVKLSDEVTNAMADVKVGIIAFGDHCDENTTYLLKTLSFTPHFEKVREFVWSVERTSGGDAPETYEDALAQANRLEWRENVRRVAVLVGDELPHLVHECPYRIDAELEVDKLATKGVHIYPVQCGDLPETTPFYRLMADRTGGKLLNFNQGLGELVDVIVGICMKEAGSIDLYQLSLEARGKLSEDQRRLIRALKEG
jgi:hypothetical protein